MSTSLVIPAPRRAEKKKVKLKLCLQGPSGSGKTWAALALARNLWPEARICVVDTENDSASLYADIWDFDTIPLAPPFHTDRYIACIDAAIQHGYDVCILDSLSHQWDGEGGILRRKEEAETKNARTPTPSVHELVEVHPGAHAVQGKNCAGSHSHHRHDAEQAGLRPRTNRQGQE